MATTEYSLERGLPASIEAERSILGAILLDNFAYNQAAESLQPDDFSLDSHRRIYRGIMELGESNRPIDLITLVDELARNKEIESVGGVAYISSLTDGLPHRPNIESYVRIVKDKAIMRGVIYTAKAAMERAMDGSEPAAEVLTGLEAAIFQLSDKRFGSGFVGIPEIVRESFGSIDALYERGQRITGLETHFVDLDNLTSGLQKSDLIILAARPSMGKTAFAMNIAENCAVRDRKVVGIFSLEMSRESLLLRMLCSHAHVDSHRLRTGSLYAEDRRKLVSALSDLAEAPLFIDDTPGISLTELRAKARRLQHAQHGLDLLVVDYLQLMSASTGSGRRYENRTQEVSAISRGLKMIAKELRVPVIALSQLSRAPENRGGKDSEPKLSDLRESGSIEQDADVVTFIYRPEVYDRDNPDLEGKAKLLIAKQRNGPTDTIQLAFLKSFTRFESLARENWIQ
ncbi:MAG TPA: replicative DNA helicase [Terriglobales bacterium]|nr:replicative DNA helicase [Terriglobales bacterium]